MNVELLEYMGRDVTVANAARVSFDKHHTEFVEGEDDRLIQYLARHDHWTTSGHCFVSFRVKAPIFVARQMAKHQVGLCWNEVSRRYVKSEPEFWQSKEWREAADDKKQGSGEALPGGEYGSQWDADEEYNAAMQGAKESYKCLLDLGVCEEQARAVLPLATMTTWIWSGSLAAWARVCNLRLDHHAQYETRQIAEQIADICASLFPVSWKALVDDKMEAVTLSKSAMDLVRSILNGVPCEKPDSMSDREYREVLNHIGFET